MNTITGHCPICDALLNLSSDLEQSEVISCPDCRTQLVVESINQQTVSLSQAPEVEEDWGE